MPDPLDDEANLQAAAGVDEPAGTGATDDLSPEQVRNAAYRRRLLDGMAASIEERGLIDTTVADIVRHARTSRRTFYEHFADRADCFQALAKQHSDIAWQVVLAAVDHSAPAHEQIRIGIAAACESFANAPALTISAVRDLPSLSSAARAMQRRLLDNAVDTMLSIVETAPLDGDGQGTEDRRTLARMAVGGVREIVVSTLEDGADLPAKCDEIADGVLRLLDLPPDPQLLAALRTLTAGSTWSPYAASVSAFASCCR